MSPWLICCNLEVSLSFGLGPLLGAEKFGGRTLGHGQLPGDGPQGEYPSFGLLHGLSLGLLGGSSLAVQLVAHEFSFHGPTVDGAFPGCLSGLSSLLNW